jgi:predicted  nucleic acid-binding Zn-ribbon protein
MKTVRRVVSVLVMVVSALLLIATLAGIFGVWWGNSQLRGIVTDVATLADGMLERAQTAVDQVNTRVAQSQGKLEMVTTGITKVGATVEQTNLALVAAEELLGRDLSPTMERLTERVADLRDTLALADQTIGRLQRLPGSEDRRLLATADTVVGSITTVGQDLAELRGNIQGAKTQATVTVVNTLTDPLNRVSDRLVALSGQLTQLEQAIDSQQAALLVLRERLHGLITLVAIILTLAFLWLALAQLGLFVHAYGVFTGRDPLARWHERKDGLAEG